MNQGDRDEILAPYCRLFHGAYGSNFVLINGNACKHRAQLVDEYLQLKDIKQLEWLETSHAFNPIEYIRAVLGHSIGTRTPAPTTIYELKCPWCNQDFQIPLQFPVSKMETLENNMDYLLNEIVQFRKMRKKEERDKFLKGDGPPLTELQTACDVGWTHRGHEQLVMEYEAILRGERSLMPKS
ncbi:transposable element Tcb2 transposase [Trichonephila clavipes]|nr:transposable element Tcb2 transposase [Trichonephila clavipes]